MKKLKKGKEEHLQDKFQVKDFLTLHGGTFLVEHRHFIEFLEKENKTNCFYIKVKSLITQLIQIGNNLNYPNKNYQDLMMKPNSNFELTISLLMAIIL